MLEGRRKARCNLSGISNDFFSYNYLIRADKTRGSIYDTAAVRALSHTHRTHHAQPQQLPLQVGQVPALQTGQVVLQPGVGVRVAVRKLVNIVLSVEAEGKGHDIVSSVVWAAVVVHIFSRKPLPETEKQEIISEKVL